MTRSTPKTAMPPSDIAAYFRDQAARCLAIAHARQGQADHAGFLRIAQHWQNAADSSDLYVRDAAKDQEFRSFEVELT